MKSSFECFQAAANCEEKARSAMTERDRHLLLGAAAHWRTLGHSAAQLEAANLKAALRQWPASSTAAVSNAKRPN